MAVWLVGVLLGSARRLAVQVWLHGFSRGMKDCQDPVWLRRLDDLRSEYQIKRRVKMLISDALVTPVTWGWWRPIIVLPGESRQWPEARLDLVLRHELAHVKRWDCLTQELAQAVCVLYWFNPLAWLAARWMRAEREKACDDFVLNTGAPPAEYAGHLVEIARQFIGAPYLSGMVAMARPSGLEQRVTAILDERRNRKRTARLQMVAIISVIFCAGWLISGYAAENSASFWSLKDPKLAGNLQRFIKDKEAQEKVLIVADEQNPQLTEKGTRKFVHPDCGPFFAAAERGDWQTVSNLWSGMRERVGTYSADKYIHGSWMAPMVEIYGAVEAFNAGNEKYSAVYGKDIINSIPPGSIYFGGTDPGRFIVTAMSKSQTSGDPIFTLTQNALADSTYVGYLHSIYGNQINLPTEQDAQQAFMDYISDVTKRSKADQLKPGEQFKPDADGRVQISGVVSVMAINGLLAKDIFDRNTNRDFFIEASWPLDWMYPNLEPHGLIMQIHRRPVKSFSLIVVQQDHDYWVNLVKPMIGDWLDYDTPLAQVTAFADKVYGRHDLNGFQGDPGFVQSGYASKAFCKLRSSLADLYVWRMNHATNDPEKARMTREADFAYRQALALYPYSPEVLTKYEAFLKSQGRDADAALIAALNKTPVFQIRLVTDAPTADSEVMTKIEGMDGGQKQTVEKLNVQKTVLLDETAVQSARVNHDDDGKPEVEIILTTDGKNKFDQITLAHLHQRLAIIQGGNLVLAPVIQSEIPTGKMEMTGHFDEQEASAIVEKINNAISQ